MPETVELPQEMNEIPDRATPLLAICIPTYNRRAVLEECLASVLPQAEALGVGVVVSDNGSSDDTWRALETLKRQYPWMQIMRHTRDIGFRDNLTSAVLSARAWYVWPMGDKRVLLPGALEFVIGELERLHPDVVVANTAEFVASAVEKAYSSPQACLVEFGAHSTMLGATVLPQQAFVDALRVQPLNGDFPHVVALFCYLASLRAPLVFAAGRALIRIGKSATENRVASSWAGNALTTFGRSWYDAIMSLPTSYSMHDKLQVVRSCAERGGILGFRNLVRLRALGELTLQKLNADQVPLRVAVSPPWWSVVVISVIPRWLLRPVLYVHPRLILLTMRRRLGLLHGRQAHQVTP